MIALSAEQLLPAAGYLLLFLFAIYRLPIFSDPYISRKRLALIFLLKAMAVPVFFVAYQQRYGGIELFDAGKFYNDAKMVNACAYAHPDLFVRIIFGLQDDAPRSMDYYQCLIRTFNWDNGVVKDYLYNDNRIIIRLHSLIHFISLNSYFVHALFSCLLSFVGLFFLYRTFQDYFGGKWIWLLLIPCFFPALWFHTGALSKEGLSCFVLGVGSFEIKRLAEGRIKLRSLVLLALLLCLSLLLKPYLLFPAFMCISFFFMLQQSGIRRKGLAFVTLLVIIGSMLNFLSVWLRDRTLLEAASKHQRIFAGVAEGGIFLTKGSRFIRLDYDSSLVKKVPGTDSSYQIRQDAPFLFWEDSHNKDTLACPANDDTVSVYKLEFAIAPSTSNIPLNDYQGGLITSAVTAFYYSLFHPMFFNAHGLNGMLASVENLSIIITLLIITVGLIRRKKPALLPFVFVTYALMECLLIGFAAPNSGAIFRYRAPAVIFVLLAALYYISGSKRSIANVSDLDPGVKAG